MAYFRELPNINYISTLKDKSSNDERLLVKNIFKRAKLRTDVDQAITAFEYYDISDNIIQPCPQGRRDGHADIAGM